MKTRISLFCLWATLTTAMATSAQIAESVRHTEVNRTQVYMLPTSIQDVVTIRGSLPAGDAAAPADNAAIATLVGEMLDEGTRRHDKFAIAEQLESVGAELSFSVGNDTLNISGRCLRQDLPLVLSLLVEQLREPALNEAELDRLKTRLIGALQRSLEDTGAQADEAFNNAIYPAGHPNRTVPVQDFIQAVSQARASQLAEFHRAHYGPKGLILVLVGDVESATVDAELETALAGWDGGADVVRATSPATAGVNATHSPVIEVSMADKTSINIAWGQATGLHYGHPDTLPLDVATAVLGQGFTGRLLAKIRDTEGLTYSIGANLTRDTFNDGEWYIKGTFAPDLLEQGLAATRRELAAWFEYGITAEELAARKTNLIGIAKLRLATTGGLANAILTAAHRGEPLASIDDYPERVNALTLEAVNAAVRRHLSPERMVLVKAGTLPE